MLSRRAWCLLLVGGLVAACSHPPAFQGEALDPPRMALDFALVDQLGRPVRLSKLRGEIVVLTFLYTSCSDLCPLVTQKLHRVSEILGGRGREVVLLAVTVDPGRDTPPRLAEYSRHQDMMDRWEFLTGTEPQLQPVWQYYWVGRTSPGPRSGVDPSHEMAHASPVHLIDRAGQIRVVYGSDFQPTELAHDIEALLGRG